MKQSCRETSGFPHGMMRLIQDHSIKWNVSVKPFLKVTFLYVWSMRWACLIGNIYHHQAAPPGSPDHGAVALGRRMPQRNICQSETRGGFAEFPSAINRRETHETYMLQSSPGMHASGLVFKHGRLSLTKDACRIQSLPLFSHYWNGLGIVLIQFK